MQSALPRCRRSAGSQCRDSRRLWRYLAPLQIYLSSPPLLSLSAHRGAVQHVRLPRTTDRVPCRKTRALPFIFPRASSQSPLAHDAPRSARTDHDTGAVPATPAVAPPRPARPLLDNRAVQLCRTRRGRLHALPPALHRRRLAMAARRPPQVSPHQSRLCSSAVRGCLQLGKSPLDVSCP